MAAVAQCALRMRKGQASAGLTVLWVGSLFAINGLPGVVFAIPGEGSLDLETLAAGMEVAAHGMVAALIGVAVFEFTISVRAPNPPISENVEVESWLGGRVFLAGLGAWALSLVIPGIPTVTSLVSTSFWLIPIGILFRLRAARGKGALSWAPWIGAAAALPFLTLTTAGFLGYGAALAGSVFCFLWALSERRARFLPVVMVGAYLGLSVFVTYMRDRDQIRVTVWGGEAWASRLQATANIVTDFEPFDATRGEHRERVAGRLDQLTFVGLARRNLEVGGVEFARGETLWNAVVALIPRAIWPDKPASGGSQGLMTRFTGVGFAESTSVGLTQILEAYVNFGFAGVWGIFASIGFVLAFVDWRAARAIRAGDTLGYLTWVLPAIALTNIGGSFVEVSASAGAGVGVAFLIRRVLATRGEQGGGSGLVDLHGSLPDGA